MLPPLIALACAPAPAPQVAPDGRLDPVAHAARASLVLRGVRPSAEESARVRRDPEALDALVAEWVESPLFLETVRDVHAQAWWLRSDTRADPPSAGPLLLTGSSEIEAAFQEEPLRLVSEIVADGRPYTDVVTAEHTMIDAILAEAYGLPFDPEGPDWQPATYTDGRPAAGVLSTNGLWLRHVSGVANAHRSRASWLARSLLCDDLSARDLPVTSIPHEEGEALRSDPACQGCHQAMDPIAAQLYGFRFAVRPGDMRIAWLLDCRDDVAHACYPLDLYEPSQSDGWIEQGLPTPSFYGLPSEHLGSLGRQVAADPRFATCAVRHFWGWFTQDDAYGAVPPPVVDTLAQGFVESGFDTKWLARALVSSPEFAAAPPQVMRSEQLARWLFDLTGFRWTIGESECDGVTACGGVRDLLLTDELGMRTLAGGQDGWDVVVSDHTPTPTQQLVLSVAAELAAAHVVEADLAVPPESRRLLSALAPDGTSDVEARRAQLGLLVERILGGPDPALVDELLPHWRDARARHGADGPAWEVVIALLLQDPAAWVY